VAIDMIIVAIDKPSLATTKNMTVAIDDLSVATNLSNVAIAYAAYSNHSQTFTNVAIEYPSVATNLQSRCNNLSHL
jgi:hypothetical protein